MVSACAAISRRRPKNGPSYDRLTLSRLLGSTPYSATKLPALDSVQTGRVELNWRCDPRGVKEAKA